MSTQSKYDAWSVIYDSNENKTRDLEAIAIRKMLKQVSCTKVLEIGAGTGKNTVFLADMASKLLAVDLSVEMLNIAEAKIKAKRKLRCDVEYLQADVTKAWQFGKKEYDLITFSLMLEHIENLDHIFKQASKALDDGGNIYIGELHPFKQYHGSKAKFETASGEVVLECFTHHISDFVKAAKKNGLELLRMEEHFDTADRSGALRILAMLFHMPYEEEEVYC